jgi:hypothetical protein
MVSVDSHYGDFFDVHLYTSVGYPVSYHSFDITEKEKTREGIAKSKVEDHVRNLA